MPGHRDLAELSRTSERPSLTRATMVAMLGAGVLAAAIGPHARGGLSLTLIAIAMAGAVVLADRGPLSSREVAFGVTALLLTSAAVFRAADWLIAVCLGASGYLACFAVTRSATWRGILVAPAAVTSLVPWVPAVIFGRVVDKVRQRQITEIAPLVRSVGLSAALLVLFGSLFVSADAAFAKLAEDVLLPDVDLGTTWARVLSFTVTVFASGALILARPSVATALVPGRAGTWDRMGSSSGPRASSTRKHLEWVVPICALDLLFASFVAVQMTVLFGGSRHVEVTPGLTYAQYARQGFFQLVAVAVLVLIVIAVAVRFVRADDKRDRRMAQVALGALCLLTIVVLASAWYRLGVYQEAYGLTRLRVSVYGAIAWLGALFSLLLVAGFAWKGSWLPRAVVATAGAGLIGFVALNPDALIARQNVERFQATGEIDLAYLGSLSEDAVPELARLPEGMRECVLARLASDRGTRDDRGWIELNLARAEARRELDRLGIPDKIPTGC